MLLRFQTYKHRFTIQHFRISHQRRKYFDQPCNDCGIDMFDSDYMVYDWIWRETGLPFTGGNFLCLPCLEARLGRTLTKEDFRRCNSQ